jgi:hypothetical protein
MTDVLRALRELLIAATRFEKRAAHHRRVEGDRQALREALTQAQLVLSVAERDEAEQPTVVVQKPIREKVRAGHRRGSTRNRR